MPGGNQWFHRLSRKPNETPDPYPVATWDSLVSVSSGRGRSSACSFVVVISDWQNCFSLIWLEHVGTAPLDEIHLVPSQKVLGPSKPTVMMMMMMRMMIVVHGNRTDPSYTICGVFGVWSTIQGPVSTMSHSTHELIRPARSPSPEMSAI